MNIDFNILWFEDNDEWYEAVKEELKEYIEERSFNCHFQRYKTIPDDDYIPQKNEFDLVLADLNLNDSTKGHLAIKKLRENNILADALFYSTDGIEKIQGIMKAEVLEGVYLSDRGEFLFIDKAKSIIDKIICRSEDIINIRGMLMDNVSVFDQKLKDIIFKFLTSAKDEQKTYIDSYAYDKVKEQINQNNDAADECKESFIVECIQNTFLIDSYKLSLIVNKIFKQFHPSYNKMSGFHDDYYNKILKERNQLAHAKKEPESDGVFYFIDKKGQRTDYDSKKCLQIRTDIRYYSDLLDEALNAL